MEHLENLELYLNLSRRQLQVLCKNNNLPANRSHTQLAKLLASFFKTKNASPNPALGTRSKESVNDSEDKSKGIVGVYERRTHFLESGSNKTPPSMKEKGGGNKQHSLTGNLATISNHVDHQASENAHNSGANAFCPDNLVPNQFNCSTSKAGNGTRASVAANIQQIEKDTRFRSEWHIGETFNELKKYSKLRHNYQIVQHRAASKSETHNPVPNTLPIEPISPTKQRFLLSEEISTKQTPSFQFFVMSEAGINLHVDLNSSPSEWINSLKDELCINLEMQDSKPIISPTFTESFSEEANEHIQISPFENIGSDLHSNTVDRNSGCTTSTLSSDSENCQSVAPQPDATFVSSESSVLTSSSIPVKMPGYLDRNQVIPSCSTPLSDQKHMAFDNSSCIGDDNAFSKNLVDASFGRKKSNASVLGISMGPIRDVSLLSSKGTRNSEQVECPSLKIDDDSDTVEANSLNNPRASIPEENFLLKSDVTGKMIFTPNMVNLEENNDACKVSTERVPTVGTTEVAADRNESSNFCELGGQLILDCSVSEAHADVRSGDCTPYHHSCTFESSVGKDPGPVLNHELGESTHAEEIKTSGCSQSQKSFHNNSKRAHSPEFHEEFHTKRHHSGVEHKGGMVVNLRSTRTSAKEAMCEQVVRPRRSIRLLEVEFPFSYTSYCCNQIKQIALGKRYFSVSSLDIALTRWLAKLR